MEDRGQTALEITAGVLLYLFGSILLLFVIGAVFTAAWALTIVCGVFVAITYVIAHRLTTAPKRRRKAEVHQRLKLEQKEQAQNRQLGQDESSENQREDENAKEEKIRSYRAESLDLLYQIIEEVCVEQAGALRLQRIKLLKYDAYGNELRDAWDDELEYFKSMVIDPRIERELSQEQMDAAAIERYQTVSDETKRMMEEMYGSQELCAAAFLASCITANIDVFTEEIAGSSDIDTAIDINSMNSNEFEHHCARLLEEQGWSAQVQGGAGDQGVDIVARADEITAVFQCKRY